MPRARTPKVYHYDSLMHPNLIALTVRPICASILSSAVSSSSIASDRLTLTGYILRLSSLTKLTANDCVGRKLQREVDKTYVCAVEERFLDMKLRVLGRRRAVKRPLEDVRAVHDHCMRHSASFLQLP
jgi:hypothetical protein